MCFVISNGMGPHSVSSPVLVSRAAVRKLAPSEIYEKYCKFLMRSFVDDNEKVKWCPATDCSNAVTIDMVKNLTVSCKCGYR